MPGATPEQIMFSICIMCMVAGMLGLFLSGVAGFNPKGPAAVFIVGAGMLVALWLQKNPRILESITEHIGWTLVGLVIVTISVIKFISR